MEQEGQGIPVMQQSPQVRVLKPPATSNYIPPRDMPDSFFETTGDEARRAFQAQVNSRETKYDGPLMTRKLRDEESTRKLNERIARFPMTTVRIRFADRTLLEGVLPSTSTLLAIYNLVRSCLNESAKKTPFYFFQTPPRTEYREKNDKTRGKTLLDLQFVPSVVFYIRFENDALNDSKRQPPLKQELLDSAVDLPQSSTDTPTPSSSSSNKGSTAAGPTGDSDNKAAAKIPKWLQKALPKTNK